MNTKSFTASIFFICTFALSAQNVPAYVSTAGLQGFWPFSANANDNSGNNYNGAVTGAALTADRFGNSNSAYFFNGTSDYILTNYMGIMGNGARAISFWAAVDISQTQDMEAVGWGVESPGTRFSCSFNLVNNGFVPSTSSANTISGFIPEGPLTTSSWHHYVFQCGVGATIGQVQIYQDANLMTNPSTSQNVALNMLINTGMGNNVTFGRIWIPNTPAFFKGRMDDIGIWNRVLTQCEISRLYYADASTGNIAFNLTGSTGAVTNLAQYAQTLSGNSQFSIPVIGSTFSGTGVSFNSAQYNFNTPPTLPPGTYTIIHTYTLQGGCVENKTATLSVKSNGTGVNNHVKNIINATLFPNPLSSQLYIITGNENDILSLNIYNAAGRLMLNGEVTSGAKNPINISQLENGLYIMELKDKENNTLYKKLLVSK